MTLAMRRTNRLLQPSERRLRGEEVKERYGIIPMNHKHNCGVILSASSTLNSTSHPYHL